MILTTQLFAWLYWNPDPVVFYIPWLNHPVVWYGLWFVFGFVIGYLVLLPMFERRLGNNPTLLGRDVANWPRFIELIQFNPDPLLPFLNKNCRRFLEKYKQGAVIDPAIQKQLLDGCNQMLLKPPYSGNRAQFDQLFQGSLFSIQTQAQSLLDRLTWYVVGGTIIGARLGHILFYDWARYERNPVEIFQIWKGGLASHGGAIGILLALYFYQRSIAKNYPEFSFLKLLDMLVVPTAFVGSCIRIGNFFNQEIVGVATSLPWGVVFGSSYLPDIATARHPVQLYESVAYLTLFVGLWKFEEIRWNQLRAGWLSGLFFVILFGSRIFLEFFKETIDSPLGDSWLQMGQLLSVPFLIAGVYLLFRHRSLDKVSQKSEAAMELLS